MVIDLSGSSVLGGVGMLRSSFASLILSDCAEATDKPLSAITVIAIYLVLIVSSRYLPVFAQVIPLRPNDKKISSCYRKRVSLLSSSQRRSRRVAVGGIVLGSHLPG